MSRLWIRESCTLVLKTSRRTVAGHSSISPSRTLHVSPRTLSVFPLGASGLTSTSNWTISLLMYQSKYTSGDSVFVEYSNTLIYLTRVGRTHMSRLNHTIRMYVCMYLSSICLQVAGARAPQFWKNKRMFLMYEYFRVTFLIDPVMLM